MDLREAENHSGGGINKGDCRHMNRLRFMMGKRMAADRRALPVAQKANAKNMQREIGSRALFLVIRARRICIMIGAHQPSARAPGIECAECGCGKENQEKKGQMKNSLSSVGHQLTSLYANRPHRCWLNMDLCI